MGGVDLSKREDRVNGRREIAAEQRVHHQREVTAVSHWRLVNASMTLVKLPDIEMWRVSRGGATDHEATSERETSNAFLPGGTERIDNNVDPSTIRCFQYVGGEGATIMIECRLRAALNCGSSFLCRAGGRIDRRSRSSPQR